VPRISTPGWHIRQIPFEKRSKISSVGERKLIAGFDYRGDCLEIQFVRFKPARNGELEVGIRKQSQSLPNGTVRGIPLHFSKFDGDGK
jgi:hypothetical protein